MPLVRIDATGATHDQLCEISEAVQQAMVEAFGIKDSDKFHICRRADQDGALLRMGDFPDIQRDQPVVVNVTMRAGRTPEAKQEFYRKAAQLCEEKAGVKPHNLMLVITENQSADWSFGNGEAFFLQN